MKEAEYAASSTVCLAFRHKILYSPPHQHCKFLSRKIRGLPV